MADEQLEIAARVWICFLSAALLSIDGCVPKTVFVAVKGFSSFEEVAHFVDNGAVPLVKLGFDKMQIEPLTVLHAYAVNEAMLTSFQMQYYCEVDIQDILVYT